MKLIIGLFHLSWILSSCCRALVVVKIHENVQPLLGDCSRSKALIEVIIDGFNYLKLQLAMFRVLKCCNSYLG